MRAYDVALAKPSVGGWIHRREKYLTASQQVTSTNESNDTVPASDTVFSADGKRARDQAEWIGFGLLALWRFFVSCVTRAWVDLRA